MSYAPLIWLMTFWLVLAIGLSWQRFQELHGPHKALFSQHRSFWVAQAFLLASTFVLALYLPNLLELLHGTPGHQHVHTVGYLHPGVTQAGTGRLSLLVLLLSAAAGLLLLWVVLEPIYRWIRISLQLRKLESMSQHVQQQATIALQDKLLKVELSSLYRGKYLLVPGAWIGLAGVFQPILLLGTELLQSLEDDELRAIIAHEEAHRQRRDPLFRFCLLLFCRLIPWFGARLFREWANDTEILCDCEASAVVGDPLLVASTLVKVQRLQINSRTSHAFWRRTGFSPLLGFLEGTNIEQRVHALLQISSPCCRPINLTLHYYLTGVLSLSFFLGCHFLHHGLENILHLILS